MTINILPDFKVFHSITVREASYPGVLEARQAYNLAVEIKTKYGGEIILPKLINDKIQKNLKNAEQEKHFYSLVTIDNSTSGQAGFDASNCLFETAKANSYKRRTLILALDDVSDKEKIEKNQKVAVMTPDKFITCYKMVQHLIEQFEPKGDCMEMLQFHIFLSPDMFNNVYEKLKRQ